MSDTEEMRRLMLHAATLLEVQRDKVCSGGYSDRYVIAATAHGAAVLRLVAACMSVEGEAVEDARRELRKAAASAPRDENGRFVRSAS